MEYLDREAIQTKFKTMGGNILLNDLMENEAFFNGVLVGISLFQQKVVTAHERNEPLKIGDTLYYFQSGRERLAQIFDKICR